MLHRQAETFVLPIRFFRSAASAIVLFAFGFGFTFAPSAAAMPMVQFAHFGSLDPEDVTEGWARIGFAAPGTIEEGVAEIEIGPMDPDYCGGCGITGWAVDDRAGTAGSMLRYEHTPSSLQVEDADLSGWTLRVRLRVESTLDNQAPSLDPVDPSVMAEYREGGAGGARRFRMNFGADRYSSPIVELSGSSDAYFDPLKTAAFYVLYELMYRPDLGTATLFVDGVERLSGYVGEPDAPGNEGIAWGSDSEIDLGRGHFNLVEWEIGLPECFDGIDNDGDGLLDLDDPSCMEDPAGATENHGTQCDDGLDNDADGFFDLADPSCMSDPTNDLENLGTACDDHLDNDSDGDIDLADSTCAGDPRNDAEVTDCDDGVDNDGDGRIDTTDAGCLADVTQASETGEIVVNTTLDKIDVDVTDGVCETDVPLECSLRAAIMHSNFEPGLQGIHLPSADYEVNMALSGYDTGSLRISDDLVLMGTGAEFTRIGPDTPSYPYSIMRVDGNRSVTTGIGTEFVTISGVTIRGGMPGSGGGGLRASSANLTLVDSALTGNSAVNSGGLSGYNSHVKVIRSVISGNTATLDGAAFQAGIFTRLELVDSEVTDNVSGRSGAIFASGRVTISNSSITGNTSLESWGVGGIRFAVGTHRVTNSTISGNSGGTGGGVMIYGGSDDVHLSNVTITDNTPNGICNSDPGSVQPLIENSIVATNNGSNCGFMSASLTSGGHNLDDDASCGFAASGDIENTPAMLGPLANYGGSTRTHHPMSESPAIDAADNANCPATDQRGSPRPEDGDHDSFADCDMGAIEYLPEPAGVAPLALGVWTLLQLGRDGRRRRSNAG